MPKEALLKFSNSFVEKWKQSFRARGKLPSAYLFAGPEGSGRREAALSIATHLLGRGEGHPDLIRIAPEKTEKSKGTIKIEVIRNVIQRVFLKPFEAEHMVVILEDAELLTTSAANSLLKTLEEPPNYVLFIIISAAPERLPPTIRSRCQRIAFQLSNEALRDQLTENLSIWENDLMPIFENPSFGKLSKLAEFLASQGERLPSLFSLLRALWHDVILAKENREGIYLPQCLKTLAKLTDSKDMRRLFEESDMITETESAIEGNVNKTLALERLFMKLTSSP